MPEVEQTKNLSAIIAAAVDEHGSHADAFVPILLEINRQFGYIPSEAIQLVRQALHQAADQTLVSEGQLYGLATFYDKLSTEKLGRHIVQFCESAPCHVEGGRELWKALQRELHLHAGQTDPQGRFTLKTVSCIGVCAAGPVILVDEDLYASVTPAQLPGIFARYE